MEPADAAALWPQVLAAAKNASIKRVGSPAAAPCGNPAHCHGDTEIWLDAFFGNLSAANLSAQVDFLATHHYTCDPAKLRSFLVGLHDRYRKPIWLTEFNCGDGTNNRSAARHLAYMTEVLPILEALPFLERYSWMSARNTKVPGSSLITPTGELTPLGRLYATPPADPAEGDVAADTAEGDVAADTAEGDVAANNPPPVPRLYETRYFSQPLDHFSPFLSSTRWPQRYLYNRSAWGGPGAPICFYTGAEAPIDGTWDHSGWLLDVCHRMHALVVFAEHRWFGPSQAVGVDRGFAIGSPGLAQLSTDQAIADFAHLIASLRTNLSAGTSPLICFGGSYAGSLAFYMRVKYPLHVDMALAASAPIMLMGVEQKKYEWMRIATEAFRTQGGEGCVSQIRDGFRALVDASTTRAALTAAFGLCAEPPSTPPLPLTQLKDRLRNSLQYRLASQPESAYPLAGSPIVQTCGAIKGKIGLQILAAVMPPSPQPGHCLNVSRLCDPSVCWDCCSDASPTPSDAASPTSTTAAVPGAMAKVRSAWAFLACTEIIHPTASNNVSDMFPPAPWTLPGKARYCEDTFGATPRPQQLPETMGLTPVHNGSSGGGSSIPRFALSSSRLLFSSGSLDPWLSGGVVHNYSDSLVSIVIEGGAHHSDLGSARNPSPSAKEDSAALVAARAFEEATLRKWVKEVAVERSPVIQ